MCGGGSGLVFFLCAVLGTEYLKAKLGQHPELQFATQKDILRSNRARSIACIAVKPLDTSCRGNKELMSSSHDAPGRTKNTVVGFSRVQVALLLLGLRTKTTTPARIGGGGRARWRLVWNCVKPPPGQTKIEGSHLGLTKTGRGAPVRYIEETKL